MCAIAGSFNKQEVQEMLTQLRHRGPDAAAVGCVNSFYIGNARLSIVGLNDKTSIYSYKDNKITFNGEVYNYKEVRKDLENRGWAFETETDTEVILKAYLYWGISCLRRFNGQFAFGILTNKGKLILARDRVGQKPLYYRKGDFAFASEAKALINEKSQFKETEEYKAFEHTLAPNTLYTNIKELPPAHYAVVDINARNIEVKPVRYWKFEPRYVDKGLLAWSEFHLLIKEAVNIRVPKEVGYALYKSEMGVDSGILNHLLDDPLIITFQGDLHSKESFESALPDVAYHLDFPVGSFSSYALYEMAKDAKRANRKVVISGEGADEVFAGYIRYLPVATKYFLYDRYPNYKSLFSKSDNGLMRDYAKITSRGYDEEYYIEKVRPYFRNYDPITAMQLFDIDHILPSLLQMGDRMAMAHGVENRCPFLDYRLIEFGLSLPPHLKIRNMNTKHLLRSFASKEGIAVEDQKKGLIIPYNKWYGLDGYSRKSYLKSLERAWRKTSLLQ